MTSNQTKPFEARRIQRSAQDKVLFVSALFTFMVLLPTIIYALHIALQQSWLTGVIVFTVLLFTQILICGLFYLIGIGKVLYTLLLIPFVAVLRTICTTDERKVLNLP